MAHEERIRVEKECREAISAIREYRAEMELVIRNYFTDHVFAFNNAFAKMQTSFQTGNIDLIIEGANCITETLEGEVLFRNIDELDALMKSDRPILI